MMARREPCKRLLRQWCECFIREWVDCADVDFAEHIAVLSGRRFWSIQEVFPCISADLIAVDASKRSQPSVHRGDFQAVLDERDIECSTSGAGNRYHNAVIESRLARGSTNLSVISWKTRMAPSAQRLNTAAGSCTENAVLFRPCHCIQPTPNRSSNLHTQICACLGRG